MVVNQGRKKAKQKRKRVRRKQRKESREFGIPKNK